ncbi:MAG: hypothetical protein IJC59_00355 [Lachnospiraceae bacterium]|nr:hypothetical protein [Lachnospiraceae bacterium]
MAATKTVTDKVETKAKTTARKTATKKATMKVSTTLQFAGKSISDEDLVKMAKEVWKSELKKKVAELSSLELYVKPEENTVYCVFNGDITGSYQL